MGNNGQRKRGLRRNDQERKRTKTRVSKQGRASVRERV